MDAILVTGGAGFIGSCFIRMLVADKSAKVINLDKLTYAGNLDSLGPARNDPAHVFVHGDICNFELVRDLLKTHKPRAVVNFAAESHVDRSIDGPREFLQTNVVGTFELLQASREYVATLDEKERNNFRFVHVSTDEVFGSLGDTGAFSETTPYAPNSPYSASKASADHFVRAFHHTFGLQTLTTNCSNNYGPYQFPEKLIPLMIRNALAGKPLPIYGDGMNIRDWLFVEDHCSAIWTVLQKGKPGETYNIGGESEMTNMQVVDTICNIVDRLRPNLPHRPCTSLKTFVKDRPGHDRRYAMDIRKIQKELKWSPTVSFEQGMEKTVRWYLDNDSWIENVTTGKYNSERLGLSK